MKDHRPRRQGVHPSKWSALGLVLACLLLFIGLVTIGCGGEDAGTDTTGTTSVQTTETGPSELADAIVASYAQAMKDLNGLLEGQPEASAVQSQIEELKEGYIQTLVGYGKQRETLDSSARAQLDSSVMSRLAAQAGEDWYLTYMDNWQHYMYMSGDVQFPNLLAGFNVLQNYAMFDILKQTDPEEAARLGIQ